MNDVLVFRFYPVRRCQYCGEELYASAGDECEDWFQAFCDWECMFCSLADDEVIGYG
jgi:hypothetical protein